MAEEIFCGRGSLPWENESCSSTENKEEKEYFESVFTSCGPNSDGLVRVSKLLDVLRELRQQVDNDSAGICSNNTPEPLETLKFVLDPTNVDPLISSAEFIKCVQACVGSEIPTPPSSTGGSVPCSPVPKGYSKAGGDVDLTRKVSELEFQLYKFTELNVDLGEQLAAVEEEKKTLQSKLNVLEKSHAQCETNNERLTKVCQDLEDAKGIMQDYQSIIANLRMQAHHLERENSDLISVKNMSIQETESLVMQLQHSSAVITTKNDDLEKFKSKLKVMEIERKSFELIKEQKEKQIWELETRNASLQTIISQLSSEQKQLEVMLIEVNAKLNEKNEQSGDKDLQKFDTSCDIEVDNIEVNKCHEGIGSPENSYVENTSTGSTSSSLKNSLHSEFKAIREDLWGPEFIGNDMLTFQPTVQLIRKIKHDFKKKLTSDVKKEINSNELIAVDEVEFKGDNIILVNKELSELHEQLSLIDVFVDNKNNRPSTSDAFTLSPFNETLTSSTQTEMDSKVKSSWIFKASKKSVILLFMITTVLYGIKEVIHGVNNHYPSFIYKHGVLIHSDRPII